jgi:hypothetical protein
MLANSGINKFALYFNSVILFQQHPRHERSHFIVDLSVHEENQQLIYFQNVDAAERRLQQESTKRTMLTAWFELNANDIEARKIYYQD